jgi:hypothetical protein
MKKHIAHKKTYCPQCNKRTVNLANGQPHSWCQERMEDRAVKVHPRLALVVDNRKGLKLVYSATRKSHS